MEELELAVAAGAGCAPLHVFCYVLCVIYFSCRRRVGRELDILLENTSATAAAGAAKKHT